MRPSAALVLVGALLSLGCGLSLEPPPVELSSRESLVGAGIILQIKNTSSEPLASLEVEITAPDGTTRHFLQDVVDGYALVEVGWKKLGGWKIPPGSEIEIHADGYARALTATLPE